MAPKAVDHPGSCVFRKLRAKSCGGFCGVYTKQGGQQLHPRHVILRQNVLQRGGVLTGESPQWDERFLNHCPLGSWIVSSEEK